MADGAGENQPSVEITEVKDEPSEPRKLSPSLTKFLSSHNLGNEGTISSGKIALPKELQDKIGEMGKIEFTPADLGQLELPKEFANMKISRMTASSQSVRREFRIMRISSENSLGEQVSEQKIESIGQSSSQQLQTAMRRLQSIDETNEVSKDNPFQTKVITLRNRVQMQHVRSVQEMRTRM